ncbi:caspase family protein [Flammeovirga sp. EKP202]|uniref:caspase family protein n=1 Tax=Flammeovirga sp. EKP202 TaxID=2770592 RepID=UPI00165F1CC8|nr:caspase family protein [Flammeovirga sp. EKP202]MBD0404995.1 SEL1-like repeat protein [Flammeovirga sp. EKP202]
MTIKLQLIIILLLLSKFTFSQNSRGLVVNVSADDKIKNSKKYALVVGGNKYDNVAWKNLNNAEFDAKKVASVLDSKYGFECELLLSPQKGDFEDKIIHYHNTLQEEDRFLLYIAGHGDFENKYVHDGFLVFKDSKAPSEDLFHNSYLSYGTFNNILNALPSKHVGVVIDVCFGGAFNDQLVKSRSGFSSYAERTPQEFTKNKLKKNTRVYLTSGALEAVSDGKPGQHSPFCYRFLNILEKEREDSFPITLSYIYQNLLDNSSEAVYGSFGKNSPASEFILGSRKDHRSKEMDRLLATADSLYYKGEYKKTFEIYLKVASEGDPEAQYGIGFFYEAGSGVPRDFAKALEWYLKAAQNNNENANFSIGNLYYHGRGVTQDYKKALEWYTKAALYGNSDAQYAIGFLYDYGQGVTQDYKKALEWYLKAAQNGDSDAQFSIGNIHYYGRGALKDHKEALKWFILSAQSGNHEALNEIGNIYYHGDGVKKNYSTALEWYLKAAELDNADAQCSIGHLYQDGRGVKKDYPKAIEWFKRACKNGNEIACRKVN